MSLSSHQIIVSWKERSSSDKPVNLSLTFSLRSLRWSELDLNFLNYIQLWLLPRRHLIGFHEEGFPLTQAITHSSNVIAITQAITCSHIVTLFLRISAMLSCYYSHEIKGHLLFGLQQEGYFSGYPNLWTKPLALDKITYELSDLRD